MRHHHSDEDPLPTVGSGVYERLQLEKVGVPEQPPQLQPSTYRNQSPAIASGASLANGNKPKASKGISNAKRTNAKDSGEAVGPSPWEERRGGKRKVSCPATNVSFDHNVTVSFESSSTMD
jgi:hypothetical protein